SAGSDGATPLPSDRSLLRRLRGGSQDAATQLYYKYAKRLRALARASTSAQLARRVDADDIVQSVFRTFFRAACQGLYDVPAGDDFWDLLLGIALDKNCAPGRHPPAGQAGRPGYRRIGPDRRGRRDRTGRPGAGVFAAGYP